MPGLLTRRAVGPVVRPRRDLAAVGRAPSRERSAMRKGFTLISRHPLEVDRLRPAAYPAGQTIQANGLATDTWHLIEQGTVRLHAGRDWETAGADLGPGDTFGEGGLVGSGELPTAQALSDVRCQVLARHDF